MPGHEDIQTEDQTAVTGFRHKNFQLTRELRPINKNAMTEFSQKTFQKMMTFCLIIKKAMTKYRHKKCQKMSKLLPRNKKASNVFRQDIQSPLQWNMPVPETREIRLFNRRNYKVSTSVDFIANKMHLVNSILGTGAGSNVIGEDFLEAVFLKAMQASSRHFLKNATNQKVSFVDNNIKVTSCNGRLYSYNSFRHCT